MSKLKTFISVNMFNSAQAGGGYRDFRRDLPLYSIVYDEK
jgi:hypothetical protein